MGRWRGAACALPAGVLVAVAALLVTVPDLRGAAGMVRHVPPFTDLLQVTATADCGAPDAGRIGSVACDPEGRPYNYPPVWRLVLHALGVGPGATTTLAVAMAALAAIALTVVVARLRIRGRRLLVLGSVVAGPPMWLLLVRGNTDLLVLVLMAALVAAPRARVVPPGLVAVGAALKIYPVGAALGRLTDRRQLLLAVVAAGVGAATLVGRLADLRAATPASTTTSFGTGVLPALARGAPSVTATDQVVGGLLAVAAAALVLAVGPSRRAVVALADRLDGAPDARSAVGVGAGLLAVTMLSTTSFDYRLYPAVFLVGGLLALPGRAPRLPVVLAVGAVWLSYPLRSGQVIGQAAAHLLLVVLLPLLVVLVARCLRRPERTSGDRHGNGVRADLAHRGGDRGDLRRPETGVDR